MFTEGGKVFVGGVIEYIYMCEKDLNEAVFFLSFLFFSFVHLFF